ncbi:hypothetical protein EWB00_009330 [Schistosoma japonicum]|nr:hypothetical protein EWB00_009330 [Schistosoma japonicum]
MNLTNAYFLLLVIIISVISMNISDSLVVSTTNSLSRVKLFGPVRPRKMPKTRYNTDMPEIRQGFWSVVVRMLSSLISSYFSA